MSNTRTILFQGDSITDAGRSREDSAILGYGYATLVKGELGFEFPDQYIMINKGISGNRIVDLYARIKKDILNLKPDILSILIGVNDVWHDFYQDNNGVDSEKYFKIYSMLIEEIRDVLPDVKIMILEPFVLKGIKTETCWDTFRSEVELRAAKAREIAEKYNIPFVELQQKFDEATKLAPSDYWLIDGVHPTTAGHELIKREWLKCFYQQMM